MPDVTTDKHQVSVRGVDGNVHPLYSFLMVQSGLNDEFRLHPMFYMVVEFSGQDSDFLLHTAQSPYVGIRSALTL